MIQRIFLVIKEFFSQKFISLIVLFTILITIFCVGIFEIVGKNFNDYIHNNFASSIPPNYIKISSKSRKKPLTDKSIKVIKKNSEVKEVYTFLTASFPVRTVVDFSKIFSTINKLGSLLGISASGSYNIDLVLIGAPYSIVSEDIKKSKYKNKWKNWKPGKDIPFLAPKLLIDTYNQSMAEANNLPKITKTRIKSIRGYDIELHVGRSSLNYIPGYSIETGEFSGVTGKVATFAMVVPLKVIKHFNKKLVNQKINNYIYAFVEVKDHKAVLSVSKQLNKSGYKVETKTALSKELTSLKQNVNYVINTFLILIIILSVVAITVSTVIAALNRTEYYRMMRILGASNFFITLSIVIKYAIIGYIGSKVAFTSINYFLTEYASLSFGNYTFRLLIDEVVKTRIIQYGVIIPVISVIPALIKLYSKSLNRD